MEDSAFSSLMISVYVIIFVIASSITIYLFTTTVEFADKAYEYGKTNVGNSVVETTAAPQYNTVTGAELLTYYYNYKSPDKYGTAAALKYDFQNIDQIDINKTYTLIYESANTNANPVIKVVEVGTVSDTNPGTPIVIDKRPSDPTITTTPSTGGVLVPNTIVEFEAHSAVNYSFLTNTIAKYYWKIEYSPEDGRSDFTTTTIGTIGKLQYNNLAAALKFKIGINTVYVTAEDSFGNKSNTISKNIELGYRNPVINSIRESSGKVTNNGNIDIESAAGVALNFVGDAVSKNSGGYIQRYDWYVDNVLVQSSSNQALGKSFTPGTYNVKLVVQDSIQGTAEGLFKFTVNQIPAPAITCSNTNITTNHTIELTGSSTANLTFNSTIDSRYGVVKYVWTIDGGSYETYAPNGINLNFGVGTHSVSVYGVTSGGIRSTSNSLNFTITTNPHLLASIVLSNEYFNGNTSYSQPGQLQDNFTITFDATPTVTTAITNQGNFAYYYWGTKTYNYVIQDLHGGYLPVAGMGVSLGTNGVDIIAHSDCYYFSILSYTANLSAKHDYKVVVSNRVPSLYIDGTLVKTGVSPVSCTTLAVRPVVGIGVYGNYVGYANNFKFYDVAM